MKNSEILSTPRALLTNLDQQRLYCLQHQTTPLACPTCGEMCSQLEASGLALDDFPRDDSSQIPYHCTHCKAELKHVVLLIGGDAWWTKAAFDAYSKREAAYEASRVKARGT